MEGKAMKRTRNMTLLVAGAAVLGSLLASGCATKKHVRTAVAPLERRIGQNEKTLAAHGKSIEELETAVSRADERAAGAQGQADRALKDAAKANDLASDAGRRADASRGAADQSMARANEVNGRLDRAVDGLDRAIDSLENYRVIAIERVLFSFGRSDLSDDAKAQLDRAAKEVQGQKRFVIEVEGFTDRTGSPEYNLALSRQRADAVVRYLTTTDKIPLRAIHTIGYGAGSPAADNGTRDGRKLNRRVEVRMLVADVATAGSKLQATSVSPQP
jgi:outer membrane protein OmpA-like peptidoglycan-associated protein